MAIQLLRFNEVTEAAYNDYISEWERSGDDIVPWATSRKYEAFIRMMDYWEESSTDQIREKGLVPATLYFMVEGSGKIIGAIHLRHELNASLAERGGHIGYGIRPSMRKKGFGALMLALLLRTLDRNQFPRLLLCCDDDNQASARIIETNGGRLEGITLYHNQMTRRYWIDY